MTDLNYAKRLLEAADTAAVRGRPESYRMAVEALRAVADASWPIRAAVTDVALAARQLPAGGDEGWAFYRVVSDRAQRALAGCHV